jgi:hypothetical protein
LTRIEYFGSKRNPKQMCENPRRHVGSAEYIILRYYPPGRQVPHRKKINRKYNYQKVRSAQPEKSLDRLI